LSSLSEVSLLFLREQWYESNENDIIQNAVLVKNLWVMDVEKKPKIQRMLCELGGNSFYHIGRKYDTTLIEEIFSHHTFDVIWVSDDGILDVIKVLLEFTQYKFKAVAGLNDCITSVFKQSRKQMLLKGGKPQERLFLFTKWLRSFRAGSLEKRILKHYDLILVQSNRDLENLIKISHGKLESKVMVLPNGVAASLFQNKLACSNKEILFVGSLRGYSRIVEWLLAEVWPSVKSTHPDATFHIVGQGASSSLRDKIKSQPGVRHTEYLINIIDVYKNRAVAVSPVFKNYGVINKVIEAMAAGVPVVANKGSFNSIPGFVNGKHGLVANDAMSMVNAINKLLYSVELRTSIGKQARNLISNHFNWDPKVQKIHRKLCHITGRKNSFEDN